LAKPERALFQRESVDLPHEDRESAQLDNELGDGTELVESEMPSRCSIQLLHTLFDVSSNSLA
jgi:hypothetical protein